MILSATLLIAAAAAEPTVETLGPDRYRLTVVFSGGDAEGHMRAQLRLAREARRLCRGRGSRSAKALSN